MTLSKRLFDICFALCLSVVLAPIIFGVAALILLLEGRPVFYVSERMHNMGSGFQLLKFRTMTTVASDSGVSGGDKSARITKIGTFLRKHRLDELPQLWNILRGDISFVGPRPPLRRYVQQFPELYTAVLRNRPGVTGLATVVFHRHEESLLARCKSGAETEAVYVRRCVPRKAKLDLIYQRNQSFILDLAIVLKTVTRRVSLRIRR